MLEPAGVAHFSGHHADMKTQAEVDPPDDETVESPQLARVRASLGARIRSHRIHRNLTGVSLAKTAGISGAMLSKIESSERIPSVPVLAALASALSVEIGELFGNSAMGAQPVFVPAGVSQQTRVHEDSPLLHVEQLGVIELPEIQLRMLRMTAGPRCGPTRPVQFDGFWIDHVLEGEILLTIGEADYHLRPGDTLTYSGDVPHCVRNFPKTPCVILCVQGWLNTSSTNRLKLDGALLAPGQR